MNIVVIGAGYVGLTTATCFAEMGHHVICIDIDQKKIDLLNQGHVPIYEPGLTDLIQKNTKARRLIFTTDYKEPIENSTACFIAVPSPSKDDGSCNLSYVEKAAMQIAEQMNGYKVIVNKSTVPVGTCEYVKEIIKGQLKKRNKEFEFDVVSNPEFLKEGNAIQDCLKPDRVVIGVRSKKAEEIMHGIYAPFMLSRNRLLIMDPRSAEMTKYAANAMLATRISFMNEMSQICEKVGADITHIRQGIGSDPRIGYSFLYAGAGYGGSCFPKDIKALYHMAKKAGYTPKMLEVVDTINIEQKKVLLRNILEYFEKDGGIKGKTIAIWGLSFKPETDDIREAPAIELIKALSKKGAHLKVFDPIAMDNAKESLKDLQNISWCENEIEAAKNSHGIALLTEWRQFRLVDFNLLTPSMKKHAFFDGRNQYKPLEMRKNGFDYFGIGIPRNNKNEY